MLKKKAGMSVFTFALAFVMLLASYAPALAHGHVDVGKYELVIGFHVEPAYQGEPNGLDLFVTNKETEKPVNGLEKTLKAEIIYGSSKRELEIRAQWGQEGAYTADVLPTAAGDYTWHIWGEIEGTPVDVNMASGQDTFSPVEAKSAVAFPGDEPAASDLASQASVAAQAAQTALFVGIAGAVLGVIGIILALMARRKA